MHQELDSEVINLFPCSAQLSMHLIMLINVKMPTILVDTLTFISMITISASLKARKVFIFQHFSFVSSCNFMLG